LLFPEGGLVPNYDDELAISAGRRKRVVGAAATSPKKEGVRKQSRIVNGRASLKARTEGEEVVDDYKSTSTTPVENSSDGFSSPWPPSYYHPHPPSPILQLPFPPLVHAPHYIQPPQPSPAFNYLVSPSQSASTLILQQNAPKNGIVTATTTTNSTNGSSRSSIMKRPADAIINDGNDGDHNHEPTRVPKKARVTFVV
jgi:hypothetical protein